MLSVESVKEGREGKEGKENKLNPLTNMISSDVQNAVKQRLLERMAKELKKK